VAADDHHDLRTAGSLPELFRSVARRYGGDSAIVDGGGEVMSYRELDERSDRLARRLLDAGVAPGSLAGVLTDRSATTVLAILGILKAGAAYVPLDPAHPPERLAHVVSDTGLRWIVDSSGDAAGLGLAGCEVIGAADPGATSDAPTTSGLPTAPIEGDQPAYVIYTSGSTGRPKGCVVTHHNVLSLLAAALPLFRVSNADRWTLFHSFSFDFSVWELWGAFATGACAVTVPAREAFAPAAFVALLARERITVLNQVPSVFRRLADAYVTTGRPRLGLRYLIFGGEAFDRHSVRTFLDKATGDRPTVVNMYGITETTVHVTFKEITEADLADPAGPSIGVPLPHLAVEVRGEDLEPLPVGATGELWVSGEGVSAGYLHRPALTSERFVRVPSGAGTKIYYRTGDLGRVLPNGEIEYHGRLDRQLKLRGFRIELGEIEAAIQESGAVSEVAVTLASDGERHSLVATLVPRAETCADPGGTSDDPVATVREHLSKILPYYMMPERYQLMDALPLGENGKTDTRALVTAGVTSSSVPATGAGPSIVDFLADLRALRIRIWVENGTLRYQAPRGVMTGAVREEITRRKSQLIAFYTGQHADGA
jgi:nonribosomal peptide synthetase DhbF